MQKKSAFNVATNGRPTIFKIIVFGLFTLALLTSIVCSFQRIQQGMTKNSQKVQENKPNQVQPLAPATVFTSKH